MLSSIKYIHNIVKNNKYIFIYSVLLVLFICFSPVHCLLYILFSTGYFLYHKKYKDIFVLWGVFIFIWYFIFTACMFGFDEKILIRADLLDYNDKIFFRDDSFGCSKTCDETYRLVWYVMDKYTPPSLSDPSFFNDRLGNLCLQTIFIVSLISSKLGISIYVPSFFHGLVYLFKFIFGGNPTAGCSPKKESEESLYPSPNPSPKSGLESIKSFFGKAGC